MKYPSQIRRLSGAAAGLGIGATLAAAPWLAWADPLPPFDPNNYAVSMDGMTLFQVGSAQAFSTFGGFAIADGANSHAGAFGGVGDAASAYGPNSFAQAGGAEGGGSFDFASADGSNSTAFAGAEGSYDSANAIGTSSNAFAGSGGSYDTAYAFGEQVQANAGTGATGSPANFDFASAVGNLDIPGSEVNASAIAGSNDLAFVIDPFPTIERAGVPLALDSSAVAGLGGNHDIAGALGDELQAISTMVDSIFHVAPFF